MHNLQINTIEDYLHSLGLSSEETILYTTLITQGSLGILELSRKSKIERTKIYRIIESLVAKGIIEEQLDYKRKLYKATHPENIKHLVDIQARKIADLNQSYANFTSAYQTLAHTSPSTSVQFYKGKEGIKQMLWNELRAKGPSYCFIYKIFDSFIGPTFFDHWASEFGRRGLTSYEIRTELFDKSFEECPNEICFHMKNVEVRYLPSSIFPMTHGMTIYDDVVSIYDFWDEEIFGVEMYNQRVADMQRVFFDTFWAQAKPDPTRTHIKKVVKEY